MLDSLKVHSYHERSREKDLGLLKRYDIILTTYAQFASEYSRYTEV